MKIMCVMFGKIIFKKNKSEEVEIRGGEAENSQRLGRMFFFEVFKQN